MYVNKNNFFVLFFSLLFPIIAVADEELSSLYKQQGIEGVLILSSLEGDVVYVHNSERAQRRFFPASTFKIPNTLIALEEGVIKDELEVIKWDGVVRSYQPWNKDQTLATAFSFSCVWCFQGFAEKIGHEKYLKYLSALGYGNEKTGSDVTTFWLEGDLAISAREQIDFLKKLVKEDLPFATKHIHLLKKIMLVEETPTYSLWAKTGWTQDIGWYVGYVEVNDKIWLFANNIKVNSKADLPFRKELVIESLKLKGLI